jgi:predicted RNA-binding Zn ribbon-like protein
MPDSSPALAQVVAFLNTLDVEAGTDELGSPAAAARWFAGQGLRHPGQPSAGQLAQLRELRSVLRDLAVAHDLGEPPAADDVRRYDAVAHRLPLRTALGADGRVGLTGGGDGWTEAAGHLLAAVAEASLAGDWVRVKICPADDCQWGFIDQSRNQSRRWCAMGSCGNREKVRTYRTRRREAGATG